MLGGLKLYRVASKITKLIQIRFSSATRTQKMASLNELTDKDSLRFTACEAKNNCIVFSICTTGSPDNGVPYEALYGITSLK